MTNKQPSDSAPQKACRLIKEKGGIISTAALLKLGIHSRTLYQLRDSGDLEQISRGIFRLAGHSPFTNLDLVTVATRIPQGVICLISALSFHEITTQIPHTVSIALDKGSETPRLRQPPISVHRFSGSSFTAGIEEHQLDGVKIRIYNPEKTLADCFKFRNRIGLDVVLEALKLYRTRKKFDLSKLLEYSRICRVEKIITPYLEALQ